MELYEDWNRPTDRIVRETGKRISKAEAKRNLDVVDTRR